MDVDIAVAVDGDHGQDWAGFARAQTVALIEPNEIKKLFQSGQKWKIDDARQLLKAAWHYLNYG